MKTLHAVAKCFAVGFAICFFLGLLKGVTRRFEKPTEAQILETIYSRLHVEELLDDPIEPVPESPSSRQPEIKPKQTLPSKNRHPKPSRKVNFNDDLTIETGTAVAAGGVPKKRGSNDGLVQDQPTAIRPPALRPRIRKATPLEFSYQCGGETHFRYNTGRKNRVDHIALGDAYFESHSFIERMEDVEELAAFSSGIEVMVVGKRVRNATGGKWPEIAGLLLGSFSGYFAGSAVSESVTLSCEDPEIAKKLVKAEEWDAIVHASLVASCQSYGTDHGGTYVPLVTDEATQNELLGKVRETSKGYVARYLNDWRHAYARASDRTIDMTSDDYEGCHYSPDRFADSLKSDVSLGRRNWKLFLNIEEHKSSDFSDLLTLGNLFSVFIIGGIVIWGIRSGTVIIRSVLKEGFKSDSP